MTNRGHRQAMEVEISRRRLHRAVRARVSRRSTRPAAHVHLAVRRRSRCGGRSRPASGALRFDRGLVLEIQNYRIARFYPQRRRYLAIHRDVAISCLPFRTDITAKRQVHLELAINAAQILRLADLRALRRANTSRLSRSTVVADL